MRIVKLITSTIIIFAAMHINAQNTTKGSMKAVTINTFSYIKDGVKRPYTVRVQESRKYNRKWKEEEGQNIKHNTIIARTKVSKLITINNKLDPFDNRVIALQYNKNITDDFELVPNEKGFKVVVGDNTLDYILGKGLYFDNKNKDFFIVDEYDIQE